MINEMMTTMMKTGKTTVKKKIAKTGTYTPILALLAGPSPGCNEIQFNIKTPPRIRGQIFCTFCSFLHISESTEEKKFFF